MSTPQIIRTVEELEALDPDTLVATHREVASTTFGAGYMCSTAEPREMMYPMVVVATGEHVRAARKALEEQE